MKRAVIMKIRHPLLIKLVGLVIAWAVRLWIGTLRYRCHPLGEPVEPTWPGLEGHYLYAFWHEDLLVPAYQYSGPHSRVLISQHADGQMIAAAARRLRLRVVSGSTTRGGVQALREILRGEQTHLVITPDGPRGPRRQVQRGLVYLAARTGMPIVPVAFAYRRAWRMKSWDRFVVPCPFSTVVGVTGRAIPVPADLDRDQFEAYRKEVEKGMEEAGEEAARLALGIRH
jgi:lysophospholipid acyltransferase (LPLAT)-like uncharacterized protein